MAKKVQVAGDATIDVFRYPRSAEADKCLPAWKRLPGFSEVRARGGALLLSDMMQAAMPRCDVVSDGADSVEVLSHQMLMTYELDDIDPKSGKKKKIWRACSLDGFAVRTGVSVAKAKASVSPKPDALVLFDSDNGFNESLSQWPSSFRKGSFVGPVFIRLCNPLVETKLGEQIQKARSKHAIPVVAVIDADDLRAADASISRGLSWERTMVDFSTDLLKEGPSHSLLERFDFLVVRFGYEGAILVDCTKTLGNQESGRLLVEGALVFDNEKGEGDLDRSFPGEMVGVTSVFVAGLVHSCVGTTVTWNRLKKGVRSGIAATEEYLTKLGFGSGKFPPAYPLKELGAALRTANAGADYSEAELIELEDTDSLTQESGFSIVEKQVPDTLISLAGLVVRNGDLTFRNVPKGMFGKLTTVERTEIENYRKIQTLKLEYLSVPASERPLCFAVFGPPGSGKSFGVKQLAKKMGLKPTTFNLSEFGSPAELVRAFHLIRDITLKGDTPLVFFDEFDSCKDGQELFWLKYFLAPMQDGEFRDGEAVHPIGKAIFVFAGGTCASFEEFSDCNGDDFKKVKGPDFVSRLRGHLSIMGPNPVSKSDFGYILRRALLLRNFLEQRAKKLGGRCHELMDAKKKIDINDGVLAAFLQVSDYRHGVRSLQSVIDMSSIDQGKGFQKSEIPAIDQLDMHVDAESFMYLMYRDEQFSSHVEEVSMMIHKGYLEDRKADGTYDPNKKSGSHRAWGRLPDKFKKSNRKQAEDIPVKLSLYNVHIEMDDGQEPAVLTDDEILYLSQVEHRRWMRLEKETKTVPVHPCMVHWEKLSEEEQRKDIDTINRIPEYLANCGLVMVRKKGWRVEDADKGEEDKSPS